MTMDVQVLGGSFQNGKVNIEVYFAPNTYLGQYDGLANIVFNTAS